VFAGDLRGRGPGERVRVGLRGRLGEPVLRQHGQGGLGLLSRTGLGIDSAAQIFRTFRCSARQERDQAEEVSVETLAFAPGGATVAAGGLGGELVVWQLAGDCARHSFAHPVGAKWGYRDRNRLVAGGRGEVRVAGRRAPGVGLRRRAGARVERAQRRAAAPVRRPRGRRAGLCAHQVRLLPFLSFCAARRVFSDGRLVTGSEDGTAKVFRL